jgi:hypothetical protein
MRHTARFFLLGGLSLAACADPGSSPTARVADRASLDRAGYDEAGAHRQYGAPVRVGEGRARAYVVLDEKNGGAPLEIGVALDERALDGLPAGIAGAAVESMGKPMSMGNDYVLPLPAHNPTPYQLIVLNWNPNGHEPPQLYGKPHFDFHFYTIDDATRMSIVPSDPSYAAKAANFPGAKMAPGYFPPPAPPALAAVPMMGLHWTDPTSPEFSPAGFSRTFIYGSWDGELIFAEPMITRDFLLTRPNVLLDVPVATQFATAGYYPAAYRVVFDAQAREYRVALAKLPWRP